MRLPKVVVLVEGRAIDAWMMLERALKVTRKRISLLRLGYKLPQSGPGA